MRPGQPGPPRRGHPRIRAGTGSPGVKTLPGANQDGSGEAATSSGCAGLTERNTPALRLARAAPEQLGPLLWPVPDPAWGPASHVLSSQPERATVSENIRKHYRSPESLKRPGGLSLGPTALSQGPGGRAGPCVSGHQLSQVWGSQPFPKPPGPALGPGPLLCLRDLACTRSLVGAGRENLHQQMPLVPGPGEGPVQAAARPRSGDVGHPERVTESSRAPGPGPRGAHTSFLHRAVLRGVCCLHSPTCELGLREALRGSVPFLRAELGSYQLWPESDYPVQPLTPGD